MNIHYGNCTAISNVFINTKLPELSYVSVILYLILERHPDLIAGFHKDKPHYNAVIMKTGMCRASVDKAWKDLKACGIFPVHNPESAPAAAPAIPAEKCDVCESKCSKTEKRPVAKKATAKRRVRKTA